MEWGDRSIDEIKLIKLTSSYYYLGFKREKERERESSVSDRSADSDRLLFWESLRGRKEASRRPKPRPRPNSICLP